MLRLDFLLFPPFEPIFTARSLTAGAQRASCGCGAESAMCSIPPVSRKQHPRFASPQQRQAAARSYEQDVAHYDAVRPDYPQGFLDALVPLAPGRIADVGCGTGKLTFQLARLFPQASVVALDSSAAMVRQGRCLASDAAESAVQWLLADAHCMPLAAGSVDLVTCAQAWHWLDAQRMGVELDRVLCPQGALVLAWNTLDVREPWVHRFTRIAHTGDTLAPGFVPPLASPWGVAREIRLQWEQQVQVADLFRLMHTRSYWLRASAAVREKMTANLQWFLFEHLGWRREDVVTLPYRFDGFIVRRQY